MKHILIGGTSFCGSTVMSLILGTARGAANVGESHWLAPFDLHYSCRYCGPACRIWTRDFRLQLDADKSDWYRKLTDRLGADTLISSDKSRNHINALDPALEHTSLVLFKSPGNFWHSIRKRRWKEDSLRQALNRWSGVYGNFLIDSYSPIGGKYFMSVERFMRDPNRALPVLFQALDLSASSAPATRYWDTVQHYIGGNFDVYEKLLRNGEGAMQLRPVPTDPEAHLEFSKESGHRAHSIMRQLDERCILNLDR